MAQDIKLGTDRYGHDVIIGPFRKPEIVAEAGVLTFGDKGKGYEFVNEAVKAGIKLLKFQAFSTENVVSGEDVFWQERLKQRELPKEVFLDIMEYGRTRGVICFASAHNEYDLTDLAEKGMPILKIGSGDSDNCRMIDLALSTGKIVILSIGLLQREEVFKILDRYKDRANQLIIMYCTTIYPTPPEIIDLAFIDMMKKEYPEYNFGYSDHTDGFAVPLAAIARGSVNIIEKHFCLDIDKINPRFPSWDIPVALTPSEMRKFVLDTESVYAATVSGKGSGALLANKKWAGKGIIARENILKGAVLKENQLMSIRPCRTEKGHIPISEFYSVAGKTALKDINKGEYILRNDIV